MKEGEGCAGFSCGVESISISAGVFEAVARASGLGRNVFGEGGASMNSSEKRRSLGRPGTEGWPASGCKVEYIRSFICVCFLYFSFHSSPQ